MEKEYDIIDWEDGWIDKSFGIGGQGGFIGGTDE